MRDYKDYIDDLIKDWVGKQVTFEGKQYNVVGVDYNGGLLIDKEHKYCESYTAKETSVPIYQVKKVER